MPIPLTDENTSPIQAVAVRKGDGTAGAIPISGTVTATVPNPLPVTLPSSSTSAETNVAASVASVQLLASNANRVRAVIVNDSTSICYVLFGAGSASTTNYSYQMAGSNALGVSMLEVLPEWKGRIAAIWVSATGNARITEMT